MARVLLVDDDGPMRLLLRKWLSEGGHTVVSCGDGAEAFERLVNDGFAYDILLTDWKMPRLDGEELVRRVRARAPDLRVVVLSGSDRCRWPIDLEVDAFLSKPFDLASLLALVGPLASRVPAPAA
ncbi:MAG: response regulator [Planctomycetes bacterium]|nr:response regulator [Planctomycetota bacterium]